MWRCLNCETMNDGEVCVICGEKKPTPEQLEALRREEEAKKAEEIRRNRMQTQAQESAYVQSAAPVPPVPPAGGVAPTPMGAPVYAPYAPPKKKKNVGVIILIVVLVLLILGGAGFGVYWILTNDTSGSSVVDVDKTQYDEAVALLESGDFEGAKEQFKDLGSYNDSKDMVKECDYRLAQSHVDAKNYIEAYELYDDLGNYKDSSVKMSNLKYNLYKEGISYYSLNSYDAAKEYFNYTIGYDRTNDYLTLIDAHQGKLNDFTKLYDILDLADSKKVLIDKYAFSFLTGRWESSNGKYLSFYKENDTSCCESNMKAAEGKNWKIEDGVHYVGDATNGWKKVWSYTIENKNEIKVYNFSDFEHYTLKRK